MDTRTVTDSEWRGIWRFLELFKITLENKEKMVSVEARPGNIH